MPSKVSPEQLFRLWGRKEIDAEHAIGQILQNLLEIEQQIKELKQILRGLKPDAKK